MRVYDQKLKDNFKIKKKRLNIAIGNKSDNDFTFRTLYDPNIVEDMYYLNHINEMYDYLWSFYKSYDFYMRYVDSGYKDPCLNFCLSKCAYFVNNNNKNIIEQEWENIMHKAFVKFFTRHILDFDKSKGFKFSTFFNNSFPIDFHYEFLEYLRTRYIEREKLRKSIFEEIDLSEEIIYITNEDISIVQPEQIEFALLFRKTNPRCFYEK